MMDLIGKVCAVCRGRGTSEHVDQSLPLSLHS